MQKCLSAYVSWFKNIIILLETKLPINRENYTIKFINGLGYSDSHSISLKVLTPKNNNIIEHLNLFKMFWQIKLNPCSFKFQ